MNKQKPETEHLKDIADKILESHALCVVLELEMAKIRLGMMEPDAISNDYRQGKAIGIRHVISLLLPVIKAADSVLYNEVTRRMKAMDELDISVDLGNPVEQSMLISYVDRSGSKLN